MLRTIIEKANNQENLSELLPGIKTIIIHVVMPVLNM